MDAIIALLCAAASFCPCAGYSAYLWKKKQRVGAAGALLPGLLAIVAATLGLLAGPV